jgi:probable rRNA maturation factor
MQTEVDLITSYPKWILNPEVNSETANSILQTVLSRFQNFQTFKLVKISVLLANNSYIKSLNNQYRKKNKPTNVLSFQEFNFSYKTISSFKSYQDNIFLGNVVFGYQILAKEAQEQSISFFKHFAHLLVHGILHLLGFDHNNNEEAEIMEGLEQNILSEFYKKFKYHQ